MSVAGPAMSSYMLNGVLITPGPKRFRVGLRSGIGSEFAPVDQASLAPVMVNTPDTLASSSSSSSGAAGSAERRVVGADGRVYNFECMSLTSGIFPLTVLFPFSTMPNSLIPVIPFVAHVTQTRTTPPTFSFTRGALRLRTRLHPLPSLCFTTLHPPSPLPLRPRLVVRWTTVMTRKVATSTLCTTATKKVLSLTSSKHSFASTSHLLQFKNNSCLP